MDELEELNTDERISDENQTGDEDQTRRKFLTKSILGILSLLVAAISVIIAMPLLSNFFKKKKKQWIELGLVKGFETRKPQNVSIDIEVKDGWYEHKVKKLFLVVKQDSNPHGFRVFSSTCTHLGCMVQWDDRKSLFQCACHGGTFDIDGKVTAGPPPRPLDKFESKVSNGRLFVLGG